MRSVPPVFKASRSTATRSRMPPSEISYAPVVPELKKKDEENHVATTCAFKEEPDVP